MGSGDSEVVVTFETIYELSRLEKNREELQKLSPTFYQDLASYLKEKQAMLDKHRKTDNLFSYEEKEKLEKQLSNIYRIVKELFERREKKIVSMALNKAKLGNHVIDTSTLNLEEKPFFNSLSMVFESARQDILNKVLQGNLPYTGVITNNLSPIEPLEAKEIKRDVLSNDNEGLINQDLRKEVKFLADVPKFLGLNAEELGPFETDQTAFLPKDIADMLIARNVASEPAKAVLDDSEEIKQYDDYESEDES